MLSSPSIVIAGAGLGGFQAYVSLKKLLKRHNLSAKITLINENNYFTFVPMLHEVAAGSVEPSHVAVPLREQFVHTSHRFLETRVTRIDLAASTVHTLSGPVTYDYLIIGLGSGVNFFNTPGAQEHATTVRTLSAALATRARLLNALESTEKTVDISIVGGGYTGVEIAGQFGDFAKHEIPSLYPGKELRIRLIESNPTLVSNLSPRVQALVTKRLTMLGITVMTNERVQAVGERTLTLGSDTTLKSDLTIWSAGNSNIAGEFLDNITMEKNCVRIDQFLRIGGKNNVYAIGDIARGCNPDSTVPFPQLGEVAYHQGIFVAKHLVSCLREQPLTKPFVFHSKGTLMPIGDWFGIASIHNFIFSGVIAWWLRRTVYVWYMPTILRKLRIIIDWTLHAFGFRHTINILPISSKNIPKNS